MKRNDNVEAFMDAVLRQLVGASAVGAGLVLPNLLNVLDKPINSYFSHLDQKARQREAKRIIYYMKSRGLLAGEYEFGLGITKKGNQALDKMNLDQLHIPEPKKWDGLWRIVFYDIPEQHKTGRDALTAKLRQLGFFQLQRSVWIHPLPCREVIEKVTTTYAIEKYVSYIETPQLDNQSVLVERFNKRLSNVSFK